MNTRVSYIGLSKLFLVSITKSRLLFVCFQVIISWFFLQQDFLVFGCRTNVAADSGSRLVNTRRFPRRWTWRSVHNNAKRGCENKTWQISILVL